MTDDVIINSFRAVSRGTGTPYTLVALQQPAGLTAAHGSNKPPEPTAPSPHEPHAHQRHGRPLFMLCRYSAPAPGTVTLAAPLDRTVPSSWRACLPRTAAVGGAAPSPDPSRPVTPRRRCLSRPSSHTTHTYVCVGTRRSQSQHGARQRRARPVTDRSDFRSPPARRPAGRGGH